MGIGSIRDPLTFERTALIDILHQTFGSSADIQRWTLNRLYILLSALAAEYDIRCEQTGGLTLARRQSASVAIAVKKLSSLRTDTDGETELGAISRSVRRAWIRAGERETPPIYASSVDKRTIFEIPGEGVSPAAAFNMLLSLAERISAWPVDDVFEGIADEENDVSANKWLIGKAIPSAFRRVFPRASVSERHSFISATLKVLNVQSQRRDRRGNRLEYDADAFEKYAAQYRRMTPDNPRRNL